MIRPSRIVAITLRARPRAAFLGAATALLAASGSAQSIVIDSVLGVRSRAVPGIETMDQAEVAHQAALLAMAPEGWDLGAIVVTPPSGATVRCLCAPNWSGGSEWMIGAFPAALTDHWGYALNAEAMQYGNNRTLVFHTDDTIARGGHDLGEPSGFGVISGLTSGYWHQLGVRDWGVFYVTGVDTDGDGLTDVDEVAVHGTDPLDPDTDDDGLLDGTEIQMQAGSPFPGCPDPLDADSDDDSIADGDEVLHGTSPCDADSDGDGLPDPIDPAPTEPSTSSGVVEEATRLLADFIEETDPGEFDAPNPNAALGLRNSLADRTRIAAKKIATGDHHAADALLEAAEKRVDDDPQHKDWVRPSARKVLIASAVRTLRLALAR